MPLFNYLKWFITVDGILWISFCPFGIYFMYVYGKRIAENKITEENFFITEVQQALSSSYSHSAACGSYSIF
jgi:hypothetical protein